MTNHEQCRKLCFGPRLGRRAAALAIGFVLAAATQQAQTFTVLHTFTGMQQDGASPYAGVTIDRAGNLYGTTLFGGSPGSPACK